MWQCTWDSGCRGYTCLYSRNVIAGSVGVGKMCANIYIYMCTMYDICTCIIVSYVHVLLCRMYMYMYYCVVCTCTCIIVSYVHVHVLLCRMYMYMYYCVVCTCTCNYIVITICALD